MARQTTFGRQLERELVRSAKRGRPTHGALRRAADDAQLVADRFTVRPGWDRVEDGRAVRLSPSETIEVTRFGRFAPRDPLAVVVGWRSAGRALGVGILAAGMGLSWWRGSRWRTGPLGMLGDDDRPW
ncbi:MAG: hypothetical protein WEB03_03985 [Nitriliruptor sp.]|uniref:hypothetical protein n=1 Tax=Nitriliruptor sp. TaxID=2448056 RepID=UPI0034A03692